MIEKGQVYTNTKTGGDMKVIVNSFINGRVTYIGGFAGDSPTVFSLPEVLFLDRFTLSE